MSRPARRTKTTSSSSRSPKTSTPPASSDGEVYAVAEDPRPRTRVLPYRGAPVLKPYIPVQFMTVSGLVLPRAYALIDSGADCSSLPLEWAKALGIDTAKQCEQSEGMSASGKMSTYRYTDGITALVEDKQMRLEATFIPGLKTILLGRADFFEHFVVSFDERNKRFTLTPYDDT